MRPSECGSEHQKSVGLKLTNTMSSLYLATQELFIPIMEVILSTVLSENITKKEELSITQDQSVIHLQLV